ncbi:hypothetical protein CsSME_00013421 [Camellia sinensis var. sinensis]|uniref:DUF7796 domain-containing protein n=1 Tax=Camellia sinensis var. sinensis TaxID=542762 RepID=A0A4S4D5X2_CAMSN|nr:uncharacterized protein LOC114315229 [Camellia sinensis]THF97779.1 hypothetical protein TEA_009508 [Camellia sinensis var. sinensis]
MQFSKWVSDLDWRVLLLILPLSLLLFLSLSSSSSPFTSLPSFPPLKSILYNRTTPSPNLSRSPPPIPPPPNTNESETSRLERSRMAVCLVGGARRFELTGPSIVAKILKVYPNSDLFLHSPMDSNAFKFSLLKIAPKIASVKIFQPKPIPETESELRVLTASNSPNGIQGLLQYFNLVEGCLKMIKAYQDQNNITYDWIVRTRVDSYWSGPLTPDNFVPGQYLVPPGSSYGGLNDRLGIGDFNTSTVALSRLSLIPQLNSAGFRQLNSETAFRAQLTTQRVPYITKRVPFCIVTDRRYEFPPAHYGVPVAAMSSPGPLSGAKCRPCTAACSGSCVENVMSRLDKGWSWTDWANGTLQLCNAHGEWEKGWERVFDRAAGKKLAAARKRVWEMKMKQCVDDFEEMKRRTAIWDTPAVAEICRVGLGSS